MQRAARSLLVVLVALLSVGAPSAQGYRAPSPEADTIGDLRTLMSAMTVYSGANGELYDSRPECLATPSMCIPGYAATSPTFLDATLTAMGQRNGYLRTFHPGPKVSRELIAAGKVSPTSTGCYAVVAVPGAPMRVPRSVCGAVACGTQEIHGKRGFCADCSGRICVTQDGSAVPVKDGQCDPGCQVLR